MEFAVEEVWNRKRRTDGIARQLRDEEKSTRESKVDSNCHKGERASTFMLNLCLNDNSVLLTG